MFEIHLTVQTDNVEQFKADCAKVGVKPIVIELQNETAAAVQQDVMTSSSYKEGIAVSELYKLTKAFEGLGYNILRKKIEVNPFHYNMERVSGPGEYYESHIRVKLDSFSEEEPILRMICRQEGLHVSRNVFKKIDNRYYYLMATLRMYNTGLGTFKAKLDDFLGKLSTFTYDKVEIECCVFDSNTKHDQAWIN